MGNSQTKEARPPLSPSLRRTYREASPGGNVRSPYRTSGGEISRLGRSSRPDLSFLGIGGSSDRDASTLEHRRETKQDREARRLERERAARLKEREKSMKEEHVDGGYLVTQGVYVGSEDFSKAVTRQLMIERRLAPFWRGLNEFSSSWTEHQLMAAARGMPIPPPDQIPPEPQYTLPPKDVAGVDVAEKDGPALTMPMSSKIPSFGSESTIPAQSLPTPTSPIAASTSGPALLRGRAKTLAAMATIKGNSQPDLALRELQLPSDPFVNGQPMDAYLYKDASECPICFLYYPPFLNRTRCCDQPICSECFVQIKRPDPHPPEHAETDPNGSSDAPSERPTDGEWQLVSESAACPFCVQPEFGVIYASPPPFRRGVTYGTSNLRPGIVSSPMSSSSSLSSANLSQPVGRRRATSLSANDPSVVTTDKIRPDWAQKLANARAHAARRSAAATALHTAAYLMGSTGNGNDPRSLIGRRRVLRRGGGSGSQSPGGRIGSPALHIPAFLSDRRAGNDPENDLTEDGPGLLAPPRGSSRRSRLEDLEEMMIMEAIRMSLASEEERRRKEEKEAKKEAKRKEKEARKAERSTRKNEIYSQNSSSAALNSVPRVDSSSSSIVGEEPSSAGKGKGVERGIPATDTADLESAYSSQLGSRSEPDQLFPILQQALTEPPRPSHLRHMSSASSSSSSFLESASGERLESSTPPNGAACPIEPMFNFRSLAAVIGDEEKTGATAEHVEEGFPTPRP